MHSHIKLAAFFLFHHLSIRPLLMTAMYIHEPLLRGATPEPPPAYPPNVSDEGKNKGNKNIGKEKEKKRKKKEEKRSECKKG